MKKNVNDIKLNSIPLLVTRSSVVFPGFVLERVVDRKKSLLAIKNASLHKTAKNFVVVISQKDPKENNPLLENIYNVGTLCFLKEVKDNENNSSKTVKLEGVERVFLQKIFDFKDHYAVNAEIIPSKKLTTRQNNQIVEKLKNSLHIFSELYGAIPISVVSQINASFNSDNILNALAHFLPNISFLKKQKLLEETDPQKRMLILLSDIISKQKIGSLERDIDNKVNNKINEQQKEYILRERLKAIKDELNEIEGKNSEMKVYLKRLETEPFPEDMKIRLKEEIERYESMPQFSSEASTLRTYIKIMMELPWYQESKEIDDLNYARKILDSEHYGLNKVKTRIIEYLVARQRTNELSGLIICLAGPTGVGKTSLARSIAKAIGRKFVKISLGGVKDVAEIRGHRRTYIGSMPGRIIQGMKKAKFRNALCLLDEIDKMSSDYRGDPASAMLEVLDPEQNQYFSDDYVEVPFNLKKVIFIATANYIDDIPAPLYDRMEIIKLSSYAEFEKLKIAKDYILPRLFNEYKLKKTQLNFEDEAIREIIRFYTLESGVRELERLLKTIARKIIVKIKEKKSIPKQITPEIISNIDYLGKKIFHFTEMNKLRKPGIITGLAVSTRRDGDILGGDILLIEVSSPMSFDGNREGKFILTGNLGKIMKESAQIAFSFIRANRNNLNSIPLELFMNYDIHIHIPDGATEKDGPSAGIALTTAILSSFLNYPVSADIGMTGEITLSGNVKKIGGLREKAIAAQRSGLKKIFIPEENKNDWEEIPKEIKEDFKKSGLKEIFVSNYYQVFKHIFGKFLEKDKQIINPSLKKKDKVKSEKETF